MEEQIFDLTENTVIPKKKLKQKKKKVIFFDEINQENKENEVPNIEKDKENVEMPENSRENDVTFEEPKENDETFEEPKECDETFEEPIETPIKKKKKSKKIEKKKLSQKYIKLILNPIEESAFFENNWEKRPVHIKRNQQGYYDFFISSEKLEEKLENNFTNNIFIHEKENNCLSLINPEKHFNCIHLVLSQLQDYFSARIYSKIIIYKKGHSISPRSDSTDTFVLQIEGSSNWTMYFPSCMLSKKSEIFTEKDDLKPVMNATLDSGDLLYFPNGVPYEYFAENEEKSILIFLSVTKITWGDFLKVLLPITLEQKFDSNWQLRDNLPMGYLSYCGRVHKNNESIEKEIFMKKLQGHINEIFSNMPIDIATDQLVKENIQKFIPPYINTVTKKNCILPQPTATFRDEQNDILSEINLHSKIRLINPKSIRLVLSDDKYRIFHSLKNSFFNNEAHFIEISYILAPGIEALIKNFPRFLPVKDLPLEKDSEKIEISEILWENCLIICKK